MEYHFSRMPAEHRLFSLCAQRVATRCTKPQRTECPLGAQTTSPCSFAFVHRKWRGRPGQASRLLPLQCCNHLSFPSTVAPASPGILCPAHHVAREARHSIYAKSPPPPTAAEYTSNLRWTVAVARGAIPARLAA